MPAIDGPFTVNASKPTLGSYKKGFVRGNDSQWQRIITGIFATDTPVNAWLTIKSSPAATDVSGVQVPITTAATAFGEIVTNPNPPVGGPMCVFNLQAIPSLNLDYGPLYYYDIKIQCSPSNNIYTVEQGWISFLPEITDAPITQVFPIQSSFPPPDPLYLFGPNPPPNGPQPIGTRYIVVPPVEGFPAEWVFASSGFWRPTSVVSYGQ